MANHREPMPEAPWGSRQNALLYGRFSALKNKAKTRGVFFHWDRYSQFLEDVLLSAPDGYTPDHYSIRFNLASGTGYRPENMLFYPSAGNKDRSHGRPARSTLKATSVAGQKQRVDLAIQVTTMLLNEAGDFETLARVALDRAKQLNEART